MIDLHMHSLASDGTDAPEIIIQKAAKLRFALCSITDHDTISSQNEAVHCAKKLGVPYITGIEFSARYTGELHILGYGMDISNKELLDASASLQNSRKNRIEMIINKLAGLNKKLKYEEVQAFSLGQSIGRPHVAQAMLSKGYVSSFEEAFSLYLSESGSCYVPREKVSREEAVSLITNAGGVAVVAHPKFVKTSSFESFVRDIGQSGFWGIEVFYPAHTDFDVEYYTKIAESNGLYVTSGSDYHGAFKKGTAFGSEKRSNRYLEESLKVLREKVTVHRTAKIKPK